MAAADQTCALAGCRKPRFSSLDPCRPHLACGNLHHQLLMAARFHPALPEDLPHRQIFDRHAAGLCALPSCSKPPHPGSSWCSLSHKLRWIFDFVSSLQPDQICLLRDCTRHVFVEEDSSRRRFCGWRHCQKHVMQSALQRHRLKFSLQEQQGSSSFSDQAKYGHEPSLESRLRSLGEHDNGITSNDTKVDVDFFHKHPWDICTGDDICWLIVPHKGRRKQRGDRITKDGFHWKQQGAPMIKNSGCTLKYFSYIKLQAKRNDGGCSYLLEEYTIANVDRFALIKLHKGRGRRKHCKGKEHTGAEVADKLAVEDIPPLNQDEMSVESFYSYLLSSPTYDDLEEILRLTSSAECF